VKESTNLTGSGQCQMADVSKTNKIIGSIMFFVTFTSLSVSLCSC
jgi:hypothetical protein